MDGVAQSPRYPKWAPPHPRPKIDFGPCPRYDPHKNIRLPHPDHSTLCRNLYIRMKPVFQCLEALTDPTYQSIYNSMLRTAHQTVDTLGREASLYTGHYAEFAYSSIHLVFKASLALRYDNGDFLARRTESRTLCTNALSAASMVGDHYLKMAIKRAMNVVVSSTRDLVGRPEWLCKTLRMHLLEPFELNGLVDSLGGMGVRDAEGASSASTEAEMSEETSLDTELAGMLNACALE